MTYRNPNPVVDPDQLRRAHQIAYDAQQQAEPVRQTEVVDPGPQQQSKTKPAKPKVQPRDDVEMPSLTISPLWLTTSIAFSTSLVLELVASQLQLQFLAQLPGFIAAIAALSLGMVARQQPRPRDAVFYEMAIAIAAAPVLPKMLFLLLSLI